MARREMGSEELRAIKKSVNKEGTQMEEGEEGGAAVYVGTKEEVTKARQLAESEGRAPDLASYIVMHKTFYMCCSRWRCCVSCSTGRIEGIRV